MATKEYISREVSTTIYCMRKHTEIFKLKESIMFADKAFANEMLSERCDVLWFSICIDYFSTLIDIYKQDKLTQGKF